MKVIECVEAYREDGDELEFDHFSIILKKGTKTFKAQSQHGYVLYQGIEIRELDCTLIPIPAEDLWSPFTSGLTPAPHPIPDDAFAKLPRVFALSNMTLSDRLRDSTRPLNFYLCLMGVKEGLDHLYSLGLNHNDINPRNIMLDKQDVLIIIDFDSCQWEGGLLFSTGTPEWTDGTMCTSSERKNDDFGLEQLSKHLCQRSLLGYDC